MSKIIAITNGIYLCKPKGEIVAALNVDVESVSLTQAVSDLWTLSFTIHRYVYEKRWDENSYYHSLSEMMELYLVSEDCTARFMIDEEPTITSDGTEEIKTINAHSIEAELQYKNLENFQINTGQDISQENLVMGGLLRNTFASSGNSYNYNLNPYTNLPIDYITVKCRLGASLQEFRNNVSPTAIKWQFDGDTQITTIPISFNTSTGEISGDRALLTKWYADFTTKYPRINSDIVWGYDRLVNNGTKSPTYDTIICVTETYLSTKTELDGVTRLYVPAATYNFTLRSDGKAYDITYNTNKTFSFNRFLNGLDTLIAFYNTFESQLSLLDLVLEAAKATDWSVGEVPESIATKKYTFTVDVQDIYSFIMNDLSHTMKVVVDFDRVYKKVTNS